MSGTTTQTPAQERMARARAARGKKPANPFAALTPKQRAFVLNYINTSNATQSYIDAGYSGRSRANAAVAAHQLLRTPNVWAAYTHILSQRLASKEQAMGLLSEAAVGVNLMEAVGPDGKLVDGGFDHLKASGRLIKSFEMGADGRVKVERESRAPYVALLLKHHGLLAERLEISGPQGGPVEVAAAQVDPEVLAAVAPKQSTETKGDK